MSVELVVVSLLLKTLREDPVVPQLKLLNERVQRLAYGFCLDGASALEDAIGQQNPVERERLVSLALEYFRQGYSRNEVPWASLCAESVALCYQALGRSQDAQRWMLRALERIASDKKAATDIIAECPKQSFISDAREAISPVSLRVYRRRLSEIMTGRYSPVYELFESAGREDQQWQYLFLLDAQYRRVLRLLPSVNVELPKARTIFPPEAQRPVYIYSKEHRGYYPGYISYDDVAHRFSDSSETEAFELGLSIFCK